MAGESGKQRRINPEMLVGVSAVVIGVCALGVSLYETSLMREEQRAAVIPLVELSRSYYVETNQAGVEEFRLEFNVSNVGIGPARVADFRVTVDGQSQATWRSAMQSLLRSDQAINYIQSTINGRTIPPDRMIKVFELMDGDLAQQVLPELDRLDITACYCSVFNECWTASFREFGTSFPVDACREMASSFQD